MNSTEAKEMLDVVKEIYGGLAIYDLAVAIANELRNQEILVEKLERDLERKQEIEYREEM